MGYLKTGGREGGSSEPPEPPLDLQLLWSVIASNISPLIESCQTLSIRSECNLEILREKNVLVNDCQFWHFIS